MNPFLHDPIPVHRDTGTLHLRASMAYFDVPPSGPKDRQFTLTDTNGVQAGTIVLDCEWRQTELVSQGFTLVCLSQTTLTEGTGDPAWDWGSKKYSGAPGQAAINEISMDISAAEGVFDIEVYDPKICWCLYNVLVVEGDWPHTRRVGIGKIHIHAFDKVVKRDQEICLH